VSRRGLGDHSVNHTGGREILVLYTTGKCKKMGGQKGNWGGKKKGEKISIENHGIKTEKSKSGQVPPFTNGVFGEGEIVNMAFA